MNIQLFTTLINHLKKTAKRPQGIKLFNNFIKLLNLTKKFKYQDYTGEQQGIVYFCIETKKWVVFDDGQAIQDYVEKKASKKYSMRFNFDRPNNKNIEQILDFVVSANFDQEKEETIWDFDDLDEFEPDYTESSIEYKGDYMEFSEYDENLFSFLVLVVFDKYNDILSNSGIEKNSYQE